MIRTEELFFYRSYRIEQAMTVGSLHKGSLGNENLIYKGLVYAVDMHRKAMKLIYFFLIGIL